LAVRLELLNAGSIKDQSGEKRKDEFI